MRLRSWVKYFIGIWCLIDITLLVLTLYMIRVLEIGWL